MSDALEAKHAAEAEQIRYELEKQKQSDRKTITLPNLLKALFAGIGLAVLLAGYFQFIFLPTENRLNQQIDAAEFSLSKKMAEHEAVIARRDFILEVIRTQGAQAKERLGLVQKELEQQKDANTALLDKIEKLETEANRSEVAAIKQSVNAEQDRIRSELSELQIQEQKIEGLLAANEIDGDAKPDSGWIYVGHFPNERWGYKTLKISGEIKVGETYVVEESVSVRDEKPRFTLTGYKFGKYQGSYPIGTTVEVVNTVTVGLSKVWAEVKANSNDG